MAWNTKSYGEDGGERQVVGGSLDVISGGEIDIESGGSLKLAGTAITALGSEINALAGAANGAAGFTIGAEAGNVINVAIQLNKADGNPATMRHTVLAYLSDDPEGDDLTGTAPDGGWAIGTDGVLIPVVASKAAHLVAEDDGDIDINITHAGGAHTRYLCIVHPSGKMTASAAITFS